MNTDNAQQKFKKRLYSFVLQTVRMVNSLPENHLTRVINNQLLRSATSILANYIEAGAGSSRKDYTNFFHHSLKSANETKVWLCLLRDTDNGDKEILKHLLKELDEIAKIFGSSIVTLKGRK